ncbi:MAG: MBOAT family O-acyltransferase [Ginsengibacter sp.]
MLFNSSEFLLFFPIVTILYFLTPYKFRWLLLLLASCIFYMFFIPVYILILFFTIIIDYIAGIMIEGAQRNKKQFLVMSIIANVGVLAAFKYFNFLAININSLADKNIIPLLAIILPLGLSFHTFQAMSYTIEVYRGRQKAERHLGVYALYVMFYPQLVAGPIERPQNIIAQLRAKHKFDVGLLYSGLRLMLWGLFKKVVVADRLSIYVDAVYSDPHSYSNFLNVLIAFVFFSVQIYCDFSGYSDIAIGAARTMGIDLMINFNRPYFSKNIREFWSRWHISLSTWFRDYLYIPLGGNRVKIKRLYVNIAIVFLLSGLWHGANWTFVVWGGLHALFIIISIALGKYFLKKRGAGNKFIGWFVTFWVVTIAWVFFRATGFSDAFILLKNFFTVNNSQPFLSVVSFKGALFGMSSFAISIFVIAFTFFVEKYSDTLLLSFDNKKSKDVLFCSVVLILIILLGIFQRNSFIYFQF